MEYRSRLRVLALGVSAAALMASAPAWAATAADGAAAAQATPPADTGIREVVVTAEKRSVNLQNVPVAVTAFTSKERALEGINSVQDLTNFTPGLTYSSQLDRPVIRGLARSTNSYTADSSVGVYDNDLFTNSTFLVGRDDMIVDQVEVLLGPQNTLYGRNAIGGIINTQSKRPSEVFGGEVREEFGNYGYNKIEGTVTGPIPFVEGLTYRLSGVYDAQSAGWYDNIGGGGRVGGIRHDPYLELQLQYKGERDDVWFESYNLSFNHDRGGPGSLLATPFTGPYNVGYIDSDNTLFFNPNYAYSGQVVPGSVVGGQPGGIDPTTKSNRVLALSVPTSIQVRDAYDFNFHWTHHFDGFDVKYVGGYSQYNYRLRSDDYLNGGSSVVSYQIPTYPLAVVPAAAGNVCGVYNALGAGCGNLTVDGNQGFSFQTNTQWYSHELNFSSTTNGKLSWIGGLYYYYEDDQNLDTENAKAQPQLQAGTHNILDASVPGIVPQYIGSLLGVAPAPAQSIFNPGQAGDFLYLNYQDKIETGAVFGQLDYKLTDTLRFTAGLRYTYDHKTAQEESRYIQLANVGLANLLGQYTPALDVTRLLVSTAPAKGVKSAVSYPTTGAYAGDAVRQLGDTSDAVTGTFAVTWTPDHDTTAYARYNRGYKAFALNAGFVGNNPEAAPESVNDYEVGLKKTLFDHRLQVDIAGFYYDYSNDQVSIGVPQVIPGGSSLILTQFINIPSATSAGIEVSAVWNPISHLNLSVTYGYDHTEINTSCAKFTTALVGNSSNCFIDSEDPLAIAKGAQPAGPSNTTTLVGAAQATNIFQSVKGNQLPQAPENKIALNANYTWYFEPGNLTLSGTYIWRDHEFSSIFNTTQVDYAPSWSQVDARATWSGNHDRYEIVLYVKNLFDTTGFDAASAGFFNGNPQGAASGATTFNPAYDLTPPRLFGAELHLKF